MGRVRRARRASRRSVRRERRYRGTFEGLQPFLGGAIPAHGAWPGRRRRGGAVAASSFKARDLDDARRDAARRSDLGASITLGIEGNRLRVYSAHARAAGGDVVAAGTLDRFRRLGRPRALAGRQAPECQQLHGLGLPLEPGSLGQRRFGGGRAASAFGGGVTIANGRVQQFALSGNGDVRLAGETSRTEPGARRTRARPMRASTAASARSRRARPRYALTADVPAADIAGALRSFHLPNYTTEGTFNARPPSRERPPRRRLRARRRPGRDRQRSAIYRRRRDAGRRYARRRRARRTRAGGHDARRLQRGAHPGDSTIDVDAPHADLSDFNDYFDTGDTLDGSGP